MPKGKEVFAGLNQNGLILFIVLLLVCLPLCWLPWVIDACKAAKPMDDDTPPVAAPPSAAPAEPEEEEEKPAE